MYWVERAWKRLVISFRCAWEIERRSLGFGFVREVRREPSVEGKEVSMFVYSELREGSEAAQLKDR